MINVLNVYSELETKATKIMVRAEQGVRDLNGDLRIDDYGTAFLHVSGLEAKIGRAGSKNWNSMTTFIFKNDAWRQNGLPYVNYESSVRIVRPSLTGRFYEADGAWTSQHSGQRAARRAKAGA